MPDRRPAFDRLSSLAMPLLRLTRTLYVVAERVANNLISAASGVPWTR